MRTLHKEANIGGHETSYITIVRLISNPLKENDYLQQVISFNVSLVVNPRYDARDVMGREGESCQRRPSRAVRRVAQGDDPFFV